MKKILTIIIILFSFVTANATHLVGGSLSYERIRVNSQGQVEYKIRLALYRDCTSDIDFDDRIKLGIHENRSGNRLYKTIHIRLDYQRSVDPVDNANCNVGANVCLKEGIYEEIITLPPSSFGYHLSYVRCCRNNLSNVPDGPDGEPDQGQTYYAFIPPTAVVNSSPRFSGVPVPFICANDTVSLINTAVDPDGDSLVYRFTTPFQGGDLSQGNSSANPDPQPYLKLPIENISYKAGYNTSFPFGAGGYTSINPTNGLTEILSKQVGVYAIAIEVLEFRKGVPQPISSTRLELQIIVISCPPNKRPQFTGSNSNVSGKSFYYEVEEGKKLCFNITGKDDDGDAIELQKMGDLFSGTNPARLDDKKGVGSVSSEFCWTPACGAAREEPYTFLVGLKDNGCPQKTNNETYSIKVTKFYGADQILGDRDLCQFSKGKLYRAVTATPGSSFDWEIVGGTITSGQGTDKITVDWGDSSIARLTVTEVSLHGCRGRTISINIDLRPSPAMPILTGKTIVCQNTSEVYSIAGSPGLVYTWFIEGGGFDGSNTGNGVVVNWGQKGTGKVSVIAINSSGCNSDTAAILVDIKHPEPVIDGSFSVCPNSRLVDYETEFNPGSKYSWTVDGGTQVAGGQSNAIKVDWGDATTGYVEVIETDQFGCISDPYKQEIQVEYNLKLVFRDPPEDTVCEFTTHNYNVQFTNGSTYHWTVAGGEKASKDSLHQLDIKWLTAGVGNFSVYETAYDPINMRECRSQVILQYVVIHPIPKANVIEGDTDLCQTNDPTGYKINGFPTSDFLWLVDGKEQFIYGGQGTNEIYIVWDKPGTFILSVLETTQFGCTNKVIDTIVVVHPKPTTTPIDGSKVVCYPNISAFKYGVTGFDNSTFKWSINGGEITSSGDINEVMVNWADNWSAGQNNYLDVIEISEFGCIGDTQKIDVWYDKPSIDMRYVSVGTPDDRMEISWTLIDAPRYDNVIEIEKSVYNKYAWKKIDEVVGADDNYLEENINTDVNRYTYYVKGYNLCGDSMTSERHTNILLTGRKPGPYEVEMGFTPYLGWDNGVYRYSLYTKLTKKTDYYKYSNVNTDQNIYIDDSLVHFEQCFRVKAEELNGGQEESWSNEICFTFEPILYVPTAFTPNNDGLNENFEIVHRAIKDYNIAIYNRWGEKLFYSEDIYNPWDGRYKGEIVEQGVYMFTIYYRGFDNHLKVVTGTVTVLR